jgi:hypothetical protein
MDARCELFLDAVRRAGRGEPAGLADSLRGLPDVGSLPSPWEAWTLIGLLRHRERQLWVANIIRTMQEQVDPEDLPQQGSVPGMPVWEYHFHGNGCCLKHKVNGEVIDVDFWDDTAEYFDTFFYVNYLKSLRQVSP